MINFKTLNKEMYPLPHRTLVLEPNTRFIIFYSPNEKVCYSETTDSGRFLNNILFISGLEYVYISDGVDLLYVAIKNVKEFRRFVKILINGRKFENPNIKEVENFVKRHTYRGT